MNFSTSVGSQIGRHRSIVFRAAKSGVAAALQDPPDLLLLDLQLPDISGHEVLRQLRRHPALTRCRFVALSADAMPESIEAALAAGFDDYWTKPIQFDRFLAHIDHLVLQQRQR